MSNKPLAERLAELLAAATPGEWRVAANKWNLKDPPWYGAIGIEQVDPLQAVPSLLLWATRGGEAEGNVALICALKNALPEIIAALSGRAGFGPEWFQDKTRPEAIRARDQMERDHKKLFGTRAGD